MSKGIICWDADVMISLIGGDSSEEEEKVKDRMQKIQTAMSLVERGDYGIIVSTLIYPEVLATDMLPDAIKKFDDVMKNKEVIKAVTVNIQIAKRAQKIRNAIRSVQTPDAIHLATAVVSGAKFFHTFDEKLWRLDGSDEVEGLAITDCTIPGTTGTLC